jgi:hypothetical protein
MVVQSPEGTFVAQYLELAAYLSELLVGAAELTFLFVELTIELAQATRFGMLYSPELVDLHEFANSFLELGAIEGLLN